MRFPFPAALGVRSWEYRRDLKGTVFLKVSFCGTGRAVPALRVTSEALDQELGAGGVITASGVGARYQCRDETQIDLAVQACRAALDDAGTEPGEIDLVISGSAVPYQPIPAMAPLVMAKLDMPDGAAAAFDVDSTCLSFVSAMEAAARMIDGGAASRALVLSSEVASRALPWRDQPNVAALFGDGAAAAVLAPGEAGETGAIEAFRMRTYPSAYEACGIGAGGTRFDFFKEPEAFAAHAQFSMDGKELFRIASLHFKGFVQDLLDQAGWRHGDVDLVVPHQASPSALEHMIRQTGFAPDRVMQTAAEYGNQIAASIPFAFDIARREGRVGPGDKVLFLGTSAGVSLGGAALVL